MRPDQIILLVANSTSQAQAFQQALAQHGCAVRVVAGEPAFQQCLQEWAATPTFSFATLAEAMPEGLLVLDTRGRVDFANPRLCDLIGLRVADLKQRFWAALFQAEDIDPLSYAWERLQAGETITWEGRLRRPDGRSVPVEGRSAPLLNEEGRYEGSVSLVLERPIGGDPEQLLSQLQAALAACPDGVALTDEGGHYFFVNAALATQYGYDRPMDLLGQVWENAYRPEQRQFLSATAFPTARTHGHWMGRVEACRRDGSAFPQEVSLTFMGARETRTDRWFWLLRDATEAQQQQERRARAERWQVIQSLLGGVAHNFNNLWMGVLGRSELLLHQTLEEPVRDELNKLNQAVQRCTEFLRTLTRVVTDRPLEQRSLFSVNDLLAEVGQMARRYWQERLGQPEDTLTIAELFGARGEIHGQAEALREAVECLVINALEAMPQGGTLTLESQEEGNTVLVTVGDTGVGLSEEAQTHLFEPFFTTKRTVGAGLSLSLAYQIICQHGGEIDVESAPGAGTKWHLRLPRSNSGGATR